MADITTQSVPDLQSVPEGGKGYLLPTGICGGYASGLFVGPYGARATGVRLIIRQDTDKICDTYIPATALDTVLADMPDGQLQTSLRKQVTALKNPVRATHLPGQDKRLAYTRPLIMGVLNVTPDSFSDGGDFLDPTTATQRARAMIGEGADIIDIGGESTRPGAKPVWEGEESDRVLPVILALKDAGVPLSIDTRHSTVMRQAVSAGASIINDVSALTYDGDSLAVAQETDVPIILMHAQGLPEGMQDNPLYSNALLDVYDYLRDRIDACVGAGIDKDRLIVDPGIGFGKRVLVDNIALMNGLSLFHTLGCPVLLGASRKRFLGAITGQEDAKKRLHASVTAALTGAHAGMQIIRVHDVAETRQALKTQQAFLDANSMDVYE